MSTAVKNPAVKNPALKNPDDDYTGPALGPSHDGHPSDMQYIGVALILAVFTAIEVAISYIKSLGSAAAPALLIFAVLKFFIVAAYFMHLKFDSKNFRRLFIGGILLASFCYIVVLSNFNFWSFQK